MDGIAFLFAWLLLHIESEEWIHASGNVSILDRS